jgi:outer membrane protein, multidrug efflux system
MVRKLIPATLVAVIAAQLAACAVGPDYHRPAVPTAPLFVEAQTALYSSEDSIGPFWGQFNDDLLNGLVIEALAANHDLRIALAHLKQSRALLTQSRLDLLPTVTGAGGYNRQHYPAVQSFGAGTALEERYYDAGFDAAWELDLWGRVRREVEASRASVEGGEASLHDAQVSVTAEVARTSSRPWT